MPRDYYDILGVPRGADKDAIAKAYRKLAKKYHPDVNKAEDAKAKFAAVQEAYEVLSDAEKRKLYDQFGHAVVHAQAGGGGGPHGPGQAGTRDAGPGGASFRVEDFAAHVDLDSIFDQFFGGHGGAGGAGPGRRTRGRRTPGPSADAPASADLRHNIRVPFMTAAKGGSVPLALTGPEGQQSIDVKIPPGIADGGKLRVRGKGHLDPATGERGDLILTVSIDPHDYFRRDGLDVYIDVPVSMDEAVFGAAVDVPTLDGRRVTMKVPPGSSSGTKLRIKDAGVRNPKGEAGHLYAVVRIMAPRDLGEAERAAFEKMRGKLGDARRDIRW
jgi:DnaJ-class molecular chaperone